MLVNLKDAVLVKYLAGIKSPTFINKLANETLLIYQLENCFDLEKDAPEKKVVEQLSINLNCNPDGWLLFIAKEYQEQVKEIIEKEFLKAYENNLLNFDNGEWSEAIFYHSINSGSIIEFIDPECGSEFFYEVIEEIKSFIEKKNIEEEDILFFELSHLSSNIKTLKDESNGSIFLKILDGNNIQY